MRDIFSRPVPEIRDQVAELAKDLSALLTGAQKLQLIQSMVVISYADGSVDDDEIECLVWLCNGLGVDPSFIQQVLDVAMRGVD